MMKASFPSTSRERGVALVITLILLSIITFMAIAFLVISNHAKEAVTSITQQAVAKQAAADAVQQAEAQAVAAMEANNGFNFGLNVSRDYQSPFFTTGLPNVPNVTNVNYFGVNSFNGVPLTGNNYLQMLNNLLVLPRPPVFITTNTGSPPDFRYYLDLNRNGVFDQSALPNGFPVTVTDQFGQTEAVTAGDPEWIGVLEHPDQPHSRSNYFTSRWAFLAQPIGNSLDLNYIHNQVKRIASAQDGFLRNQGVGSWEINLAGFLNGLNPNYWIYGNGLTGPAYAGLDTNTPPLPYNSSLGTAFQDAAALLRYRYNGSYFNLPSFSFFYSPTPYSFYPPAPSLIDYYSAGPLMIGEGAQVLNENLNASWSGGRNANPMFTHQDFFSTQAPGFPANSFTNRLLTAGSVIGGPNQFSQYTYYRMLAQMGMESAPEPATKLNLNYVNIGGYGVSNFVPWTDNQLIEFPRGSGIMTSPALVFFTNAANLLLGAQTNSVVSTPWNTNVLTNLWTGFIPVYPTNYYTPSVHRMLQLAANIYDAANPKPIVNPNDFDYPSVFRPIFGTDNTNIWVKGYVEVSNAAPANADYNFPVYSLQVLSDRTAIFSNIINRSNNFNVFGVPWVIGAKKGLPNFNEISLESFTQLTRKLQIVKPSVTADRTTWHTNVQYILSVSNALMAEAWNSYIGTYPRAVYIGGIDTLYTTLTNENGIISPIIAYSTNISFSLQPATQPAAGTWAGTGFNMTSNIGGSFRFPLLSSTIFLPASIYSTNTVRNGTFINYPDPLDAGFDTTTGYPLPRFGLNLTNRLRFVMVDNTTGRVIDYVQLDGMGGQRDLTGAGELKGNDNWADGGPWVTNRMGNGSPNNSIVGIENQISISQSFPASTPGYNPVTLADWQNAIAPGFKNSVQTAVNQFNAFFNGTNGPPTMQVPYTPTRTVCVYYTWQANDPLVHYTLPDLTDLIDSAAGPQTNWVYTNNVSGNLGQINQRYMPWGGSINGGNPDYNTNMSLKDPLVTRSDDWQFPDYKMPGIGWLGRVHRGTPWQTVYMKSSPVDTNQWQRWTGNLAVFPGTNVANLTADATFSQPINDWGIFDLFTTAPNDNATRGQLSVNQTNFAAWAALLDGVIVLTNDPVNGLTNILIDPNAANGAVAHHFHRHQ